MEMHEQLVIQNYNILISWLDWKKIKWLDIIFVFGGCSRLKTPD
jgi:hypothetical protein